MKQGKGKVWYDNCNVVHIYSWGLADLQGFDKSPEKSSDALSFAEQLHQPQHSEQAEERDGYFSVFSFTLEKQKY